MGVKERLVLLFGREQRVIDPFTQLIRVADGKEKFPDMSREEEKEAKRLYGNRRIAHQLRAIRELGESCRQEALDYLRRFYEMTASSENYGDTFGAVMPPVDHFYLNAKGPLRWKLGWTDYTGHPDNNPENYEPHKTIRTAISNLEKKLNT